MLCAAYPLSKVMATGLRAADYDGAGALEPGTLRFGDNLLVEGQGQSGMIYDRILSVIDLEVLQQLVISDAGDEDGDEDMGEMGTEGLVLLEILKTEGRFQLSRQHL